MEKDWYKITTWLQKFGRKLLYLHLIKLHQFSLFTAYINMMRSLYMYKIQILINISDPLWQKGDKVAGKKTVTHAILSTYAVYLYLYM